MQNRAHHENTLPFGPCAGPAIMGHRAFFCQGFAFETFDPADVFGLGTVIICGNCKSLRESQVIETNTLTLERAA